jgi:hypothetical protein
MRGQILVALKQIMAQLFYFAFSEALQIHAQGCHRISDIVEHHGRQLSSSGIHGLALSSSSF